MMKKLKCQKIFEELESGEKRLAEINHYNKRGQLKQSIKYFYIPFKIHFIDKSVNIGPFSFLFDHDKKLKEFSITIFGKEIFRKDSYYSIRRWFKNGKIMRFKLKIFNTESIYDRIIIRNDMGIREKVIDTHSKEIITQYFKSTKNNDILYFVNPSGGYSGDMLSSNENIIFFDWNGIFTKIEYDKYNNKLSEIKYTNEDVIYSIYPIPNLPIHLIYENTYY